MKPCLVAEIPLNHFSGLAAAEVVVPVLCSLEPQATMVKLKTTNDEASNSGGFIAAPYISRLSEPIVTRYAH